MNKINNKYNYLNHSYYIDLGLSFYYLNIYSIKSYHMREENLKYIMKMNKYFYRIYLNNIMKKIKKKFLKRQKIDTKKTKKLSLNIKKNTLKQTKKLFLIIKKSIERKIKKNYQNKKNYIERKIKKKQQKLKKNGERQIKRN